MNKGQVVWIVAGSVLFLWFAIPFIGKGILNIGKVTGMALATLFLFYGIFQRRFHLFLVHLKGSRGGAFFLSVVGILAALIVAVAVIETVWMVFAASKRPPENTPAVVLGCSVKGTRPSRILQERLDAAYAYLTENENVICILSGGQGEGEEITEAECMYRYLTGKGIEPRRLLKEEASTNTEENLRYAKQLLEEQGLGSRITIVTSEFHEYRANAVAKKLELESYSTPSRTFFIYFPTYYMRELYGILYYMIGK